jgi:hypothetical protein
MLDNIISGYYITREVKENVMNQKYYNTDETKVR